MFKIVNDQFIQKSIKGNGHQIDTFGINIFLKGKGHFQSKSSRKITRICWHVYILIQDPQQMLYSRDITM